MKLSKIMPVKGCLPAKLEGFALGGKKILFLSLALLLVTGCTNSASNGIVTEKNVSENETNNNELTIPVKPIEKQEININQDAPQSGGQVNNMEKAKIQTSLGDIVIELNAEKAPITVENFKSYIVDGFYSGTLFHRVMPGFMVQGGGFDTNKTQKATKAEIKNEAKNGLKNDRGTLAMARTNVVDSATSQFFINLVDNDFLNYQNDENYGYAVFGQVVEGMDVVDKIAEVKTGNNGPYQNWPVEDVVIENIELVK